MCSEMAHSEYSFSHKGASVKRDWRKDVVNPDKQFSETLKNEDYHDLGAIQVYYFQKKFWILKERKGLMRRHQSNEECE